MRELRRAAKARQDQGAAAAKSAPSTQDCNAAIGDTTPASSLEPSDAACKRLHESVAYRLPPGRQLINSTRLIILANLINLIN